MWIEGEGEKKHEKGEGNEYEYIQRGNHKSERGEREEKGK